MQYLLAIFFALFLSACSTLQKSVDYKADYDFSAIKTFTIKHKLKSGESSITVDRITEALQKVLTQKGLSYTKELAKADVVVLFHLNVTNKTEIYTDYEMVGFGRYGGAVIATPRSYNYDEGRLIIDLYDPKINKTVYRVELSDELDHHKNPKERDAYVLEVVTKAFDSFPPK